MQYPESNPSSVWVLEFFLRKKITKRQDHTAWPSAKAHRTRHDIGEPDPCPPKPRTTHRSMSLVRQHRRAHRSPPHVRDDRETPLSSRRDAGCGMRDAGCGIEHIF